MKYLLDTHALLWWFHEPAALSERVREIISDPESEIAASAVSAMEIATKTRKGKLEYRSSLANRFTAEVLQEGFAPLAVTCEHAIRAGSLESAHADPWDRLLAAQSMLEELTLVSLDPEMAELCISTLW